MKAGGRLFPPDPAPHSATGRQGWGMPRVGSAQLGAGACELWVPTATPLLTQHLSNREEEPGRRWLPFSSWVQLASLVCHVAQPPETSIRSPGVYAWYAGHAGHTSPGCPRLASTAASAAPASPTFLAGLGALAPHNTSSVGAGRLAREPGRGRHAFPQGVWAKMSTQAQLLTRCSFHLYKSQLRTH